MLLKDSRLAGFAVRATVKVLSYLVEGIFVSVSPIYKKLESLSVCVIGPWDLWTPKKYSIRNFIVLCSNKLNYSLLLMGPRSYRSRHLKRLPFRLRRNLVTFSSTSWNIPGYSSQGVLLQNTRRAQVIALCNTRGLVICKAEASPGEERDGASSLKCVLSQQTGGDICW